MRRHPRSGLALFMVLSLALHLGARALWSHWPDVKDRAAAAAAVIPLVRSPRPAPADEADPVAAPPAGTQRFRPVEAADATEAVEPAVEAEPDAGTTTTDAEVPAEAPAESTDGPRPEENPPAAPAMAEADRAAYRKRLLRDFEPEWERIPDLVVAADTDTQRAVARTFGMILIAYPAAKEKPGYAILLDPEGGTYQYTRDFDFGRFSNRVKDRTHVRAYAALARKAADRLALTEPLVVVSLVPAAADAYFAAKQMAAVAAAGLNLEEVVRTEGRYVRAGDTWALVIDRVVTRDGGAVRVQDPEAA